MNRSRLTHLAFLFLLLASCKAWEDGTGCRTPDDDDGGDEPVPADTCKPGDQTCHGGAPADDAPPPKKAPD